MNNFVKYSIFDKYKNLIHGSTTKKCSFDSLLKLNNCNKSITIVPKQVHGKKTIFVDSSMINKKEDYFIGDALVTNEKNIVLVIRTADCLPIFLYNQNEGIIGLIHAGWRGMAEDIIRSFINEVKGKYNVSPESYLAAIGPSINKDCYEVGEEVVNKLTDIYKSELKSFLDKKSNNKWTLDLKLLAKYCLIKQGLKEENIEVSRLCTHCNKDLFFSYRRDQEKLGNIYSILCIKNKYEN